MLNRTQKEEKINLLNEKFSNKPSLFVVEYKGLSVKQLEGIRKSLKKKEAEFEIVKNSLLIKAAENTDIQKINDLFEGPTAIAICTKDSPEVAKVFVKSSEDIPNLKIKGGIVEGTVVDHSEIERISKLPSREELIAQFMGLITTPLNNFAGSLKQMQLKFVYALQSLKDKKEK